MPQPGRLRTADVVLGLLILCLAGGVRAGYLSACARNGAAAGPLQVQTSRGDDLDELALRLSRDQGYVGSDDAGPRAHPAPLYPWLLSVLLRTTPDAEAMHHLARWVQCGLGALTALLLFLFARWAFHSLAVALLAGLLGALHPFWVINTAEIADGVLATFLLTLCLWLGARGSQAGGPLTSWSFGLALASLALTRAALVPFAFVALLAFFRGCRRLDRGWMLALLGLLGFAGGLAPWFVRNVQVFHDVYPVVDSAVYHLWVGNQANASGGPLPDVAQENPELTDRQRMQEVADEIRGNPAGFLRRRLWAGLDFFFGADWFKDGKLWRGPEATDQETSLPDWFRRSYAALLCGSLLGMLLFGVLGWRWAYPWRREALPAAAALLWVPLPYLIGHAEALAGPRLPLDGVLLCYAAYALVWLGSAGAEPRP
jgi:4-amino-4-deoxy-L-arabinose transferase-like glycosyltransferase